MTRIIRILCYTGVVTAIVLSTASCRKEFSEHIDTVAAPIEASVQQLSFGHAYYHSRVAQKTQAFYEANGFRKMWLERRKPSKRFRAFANEVKNCYRYGMSPDDYGLDNIERELEKVYDNRNRSEADLSALDVRITASFFHFTTHLLEGRIRIPGAKEFIWKRSMPNEDDVAMLLDLHTARDIRKQFEALHPDDEQYDKMQDALIVYKELEQQDPLFKPLKNGLNIRPRDVHESIPAIRRKLRLTDLEISSVGDDSMRYDEALMRAVMKFQRRHGLKDDGIITGQTVSFLNMSFGQRAEVIALNLERLRWRPHTTTANDAFIVNVPEYMLRVYHDHKKKLEMRVVLGAEFNATPIFHDTLKHIVFSPTWNVPPSIFQEEFLPNLRSDPSHYSAKFTFLKNGVEIDPADEEWNNPSINPREYQAIQQPGPDNSLGLVKFVMPNNFNIYLHDTPAGRLFNKYERALSHGCIRLEEPFELSKYLLKDQKEWNARRIAEAMGGIDPVHVKLKKDYAVQIVYRTAWIDEGDVLNFRDDIYGHDQRHLKQLKKVQPTLSMK